MVKKRIVHIISGLGQGGAESILMQHLKFYSTNHETLIHVISLTNNNFYEEEIKKNKAFVHFIEIKLTKPLN